MSFLRSIFGPNREELVSILKEAIEGTVVTLDPEKRYLLLLPEIPAAEFENLKRLLEDVLEIEKTNLRVVMLSQNGGKLLEL